MSLTTTEKSPASTNAQSEALISRAAQEVQAAMVIAKKFPRDEERARERINKACGRLSLAQNAEYEFTMGGKAVTGPTIRLAEVIAQSWGNLDFGIIELGQSSGESQLMAYCWDLETNTRQTKIFTVPHVRYSKEGGAKRVGEDPRDVYNVVANQGARRMRACILGVVPGDVIEEAVDTCNRTLDAASGGKPLGERINAAAKAMEEYGVTAEMIEKKFGCNLSALSDRQVRMLGRIFNSLRDGLGKVEGFFEVQKPPAETKPTASEATGMFQNADTGNGASTPAPEKKDLSKAADTQPEKTAAPSSAEPTATQGAAGGGAAGGPAQHDATSSSSHASSPSSAPAAPEGTSSEVAPGFTPHEDLAAKLEAEEIPAAVLVGYARDTGAATKSAKKLEDVPESEVVGIIKGWAAVKKLLKQRIAEPPPATTSSKKAK